MTGQRREEVAALLEKVRWTNADIRTLTGWSRHQVLRWKRRIGLSGGRWVYRCEVRLRAPELWWSLEGLDGDGG